MASTQHRQATCHDIGAAMRDMMSSLWGRFVAFWGWSLMFVRGLCACVHVVSSVVCGVCVVVCPVSVLCALVAFSGVSLARVGVMRCADFVRIYRLRRVRCWCGPLPLPGGAVRATGARQRPYARPRGSAAFVDVSCAHPGGCFAFASLLGLVLLLLPFALAFRLVRSLRCRSRLCLAPYDIGSHRWRRPGSPSLSLRVEEHNIGIY